METSPESRGDLEVFAIVLNVYISFKKGTFTARRVRRWQKNGHPQINKSYIWNLVPTSPRPATRGRAPAYCTTGTSTPPQPCRPREYAFAKSSFPVRFSVIESIVVCLSIRFQFFSSNLSTLSFTWVQNGTRHFFTPPHPLFWSTTSIQIFAFMTPQRHAKSMWYHHMHFWSTARLGLLHSPSAL